MVDETVFEQLPSIYPTDNDDLWRPIGETLQRSFDSVSSEAYEARLSRYLDTAEDNDLEEYAKRYLTLGQRRGRSEEAFRGFLRGITLAYQGEGHRSDIRAAVAAGLLMDNEPYHPGVNGGNIQFIGYPAELEFDLILREHAWNDHPGGVVRDLAEFADASCVELRDLEYMGRTETVVYGGRGRIVEQVREDGQVSVGGGERIVEYETTDRFTGEERFPGQDKKSYGEDTYGEGVYGDESGQY